MLGNGFLRANELRTGTKVTGLELFAVTLQPVSAYALHGGTGLTTCLAQLFAPALLGELCRTAGETLDPLGNWRVRAEEAAEVHSKQRLHDEQVRGRRSTGHGPPS